MNRKPYTHFKSSSVKLPENLLTSGLKKQSSKGNLRDGDGSGLASVVEGFWGEVRRTVTII